MAEVTNLFDMVTTREEPTRVEARRVCNFQSRLGTRCNQDALDNAMVCLFHKGGRNALIHLRREIVGMGPVVVARLQELIEDENGLVSVNAAKLWTELSGVRELPHAAANIDEEELDAARRSLSRKLDAVASRVLQRKSA